MIIYFVRHAHPDYKKDCLTELGRLQAEAASGVLCKLGIKRIFSSTNGRAHETAEYTAKKLGLEIIPCDFMREIPWGPLEGKEVPVKGHPWHMAAYQAAEKAIEDTFGKKPLPFYSGGSIPIISGFERILGIKSLLIGFGLSEDAIHSPNESYGLDQFDKGVRTIPYFYKHFAESK